MRIKKLHIQNYKSLVDFQLENLPQFCAFVGPNASGKSNIFEAMEFMNYVARFPNEAVSFFGGKENIFSYYPRKLHNQYQSDSNLNDIGFLVWFQSNVLLEFEIKFSNEFGSEFKLLSTNPHLNFPVGPRFEPLWIGRARDMEKRKKFIKSWTGHGFEYDNEFENYIDNFSRIFVGQSNLNRTPSSNIYLSADGANVAQILGRIFSEKSKKEDFIEWVKILIPEFQNIEVKQSNIDGSFEFFVYERGSSKPFPRHLLSDGTKNILALMAAVYQSNYPQFLCIEEPENGLHPQAIEQLVDFFKQKCKEEGHHIWLNTHSQTLVRCLEIDEIITVNKINGETKARQFSKEEAFDMKMDEAWLTNALGGGVL